MNLDQTAPISYYSTKIYVVGTQKYLLHEMHFLSVHNICKIV